MMRELECVAMSPRTCTRRGRTGPEASLAVFVWPNVTRSWCPLVSAPTHETGISVEPSLGEG